ncbi:alpha carbonic anhydrase [Roridomyces roridus]|uniref:Carbonic anhydrase n=1 Tax=Roridomyces roridus TaxID=1738132 RepID=A0AAD7FG95_9AGAR|nr:alpha carbonic anhydrase [Roridomyces roridus]
MLTELIIAIVLASSASASCLHGTSFMPREEGQVPISKFGYTGLQGPLNWAGLDAANIACRTGKTQSPISIDDSIAYAKSAPKVEIMNVKETEFENLGTTLEVFHLHTPSEHRIRDEYFPLEMHMVHEAEDKSIAVLAIPFQLTEDGSTTELLTKATENIEDVREPGTATKTGELDFTELIMAIEKGPLFQYTGSLTTPPCAEGLTFLVLEKPLALNVQTYNTLKSVIRFNSRYTQNHLGQDNLLASSAKVAAKEDGCMHSTAGMQMVSMEKVVNHCTHMCKHKQWYH